MYKLARLDRLGADFSAGVNFATTEFTELRWARACVWWAF